jgi:hypothetical protein
MMMKKYVTAVCLMFTCVGLGYGDISLREGQQNASLDGHLDVDSVVGTEIALRAGYGQYVRDLIEVGGQVEFADNDFVTRYAISAYGEYNWDLDYFWVPFAGASLGLGGVDSFDGSGDGVGLELGLRGGAKYFLLDNIALTGSLGIGLSTGDTFDDGGSAESVDVRIDLGMRYYW